MKISIVTITARDNPRLDVAGRTLAYTVGKLAASDAYKDVAFDWIIVDELGRDLNTLGIDFAATAKAAMPVHVIEPFASSHRRGTDKRPAHNSARNAGLDFVIGQRNLDAVTNLPAHELADGEDPPPPSQDYVVFMHDCNVVTADWATVAADCARQGLGWKCKTRPVFDMAISADGMLRHRDHNDLLRPIPPLSAGGACWGVPLDKLLEVRGFDLAYDGCSYSHDLECVLRLSRVGVAFVTTERAFTVQLRRTKLDSEISTNKEAHVGKANRSRVNKLRGDVRRTRPEVVCEQIRAHVAILDPAGADDLSDLGDADLDEGQASIAREAKDAHASKSAAGAPRAANDAAPLIAIRTSDLRVALRGLLTQERCIRLLEREHKGFEENYLIVRISQVQLGKGGPGTEVVFRPREITIDQAVDEGVITQDDIDEQTEIPAAITEPAPPAARNAAWKRLVELAEDGRGRTVFRGALTAERCLMLLLRDEPTFSDKFRIVELRPLKTGKKQTGTEVIFEALDQVHVDLPLSPPTMTPIADGFTSSLGLEIGLGTNTSEGEDTTLPKGVAPPVTATPSDDASGKDSVEGSAVAPVAPGQPSADVIAEGELEALADEFDTGGAF